MAMNNYRSVLEVLKLCVPKTVLKEFALVSHVWTSASSSQELWSTVLEDLNISYESLMSPQTTLLEVKRQQRRVVALTSTAMAVLNVETEVWEITTLAEPFEGLEFAYTVLLSLSIFCCGGENAVWNDTDLTHEVLGAVRIINPDGTIAIQPDMLYARYQHGIVALGTKVYVFGGIGKEQKALLHNEMYDNFAWVRLPDLYAERISFVPSVHQGSIYLCGGSGNTSVEIFHPETMTFAIMGELAVTDPNESVGVKCQDCFLVVTRTTIYRWNSEMKTVKTIKRQCHPKRVVQCGDLLYIVSGTPFFGCQVIDIVTGKHYSIQCLIR